MIESSEECCCSDGECILDQTPLDQKRDENGLNT